jgi:hypothetical protein
LANDGRLVGTGVVHDDDIAWRERRDQYLLDIGREAASVDRAVEDAGCGEAIATQRTDEGQGALVAVRSKAAQPLALHAPSAQRRHVGLDPGLVDEDHASGIEIALDGPPAPTPASNAGTRLLKGEQRFF